LIKVLRKELLIYFVILVALSLFMHPERISMIDTPLKLLHAFAWSFGAYVVVAVLRWIVSVVLKVFKRKKAES
jgi:uncharacterized membrane protein